MATQKRHLYEIDLMRTFIMLGVLSVHTIARFIEMIPSKTSPGLITLGTIITSLHFTRESFMFITGFVLFITYYHRDFSAVSFWKKRLILVAIPYLVWNLLYIIFGGTYTPGFDWSIGPILHNFGISVITGRQFYLYFILVSIQFYVVFPFLIWGLRRLERWHLHIFIGSFVVELVFMYLIIFYLPHAHVPAILSNKWNGTFILTYEFWFISGGIIAAHYDKILDFVSRHAKLLLTCIVIGVLAVWGHYLVNSLLFHHPGDFSVLQPIMVPYSLLITLGFWYGGLLWSRRRLKPQWKGFSAYIQLASNTSFGMFLVQPIPLFLMEAAVKRMYVPAWIHYVIFLPLSIAFVYGVSMLLSYCIGRIPYVAYIVGRKVKSWA